MFGATEGAAWPTYGLMFLALLLLGLVVALWLSQGRRRYAPLPMLSVLLLVRNQAHLVEGVVRLLVHRLQAQGMPTRVELVVVDHGSTDETPQIVERLAREFPGLRVVRLEPRLCVGQPLCSAGLAAAQSRVAVVLDLLGAVEVRPLLESIALLTGSWPRGHRLLH